MREGSIPFTYRGLMTSLYLNILVMFSFSVISILRDKKGNTICLASVRVSRGNYIFKKSSLSEAKSSLSNPVDVSVINPLDAKIKIEKKIKKNTLRQGIENSGASLRKLFIQNNDNNKKNSKMELIVSKNESLKISAGEYIMLYFKTHMYIYIIRFILKHLFNLSLSISLSTSLSL